MLYLHWISTIFKSPFIIFFIEFNNKLAEIGLETSNKSSTAQSEASNQPKSSVSSTGSKNITGSIYSLIKKRDEKQNEVMWTIVL